jgi:hypothetical protein
MGNELSLLPVHPTAFIMDLTFPEEPGVGAEVLGKEFNHTIPAIFMTNHTGLISRLEGVRSGGHPRPNFSRCGVFRRNCRTQGATILFTKAHAPGLCRVA